MGPQWANESHKVPKAPLKDYFLPDFFPHFSIHLDPQKLAPFLGHDHCSLLILGEPPWCPAPGTRAFM